MLTTYLALVSKSKQINNSETSAIAASLQKQITRDFSPIWKVPATIDAFADLKSVPSGYWPIIIKDNIRQSGAAGVHMDRHGQPYSLVQAAEDTAQTCSHECLEMLVDPFGNRMVASQSIKPGQGRVKYLVEVCDPSESPKYGYTVNGILLSDFYTPNFFDPSTASSVRYSYTGAITKPRQVLRDGYLSWMIPETGEWWQATYFGTKVSYASLGIQKRKAGQSWRELINALAEKNEKKEGKTHAKAIPKLNQTTSEKWARNLEEDIEDLLGS